MGVKPGVEGAAGRKKPSKDETAAAVAEHVSQRHEVYSLMSQVSSLMAETMFDLSSSFYGWLADRVGRPEFIHLTHHLMDALGFDLVVELEHALRGDPEDIPVGTLDAITEFYLNMDWESSCARSDYAGENLHPYILGLIMYEVSRRVGHPGWHC